MLPDGLSVWDRALECVDMFVSIFFFHFGACSQREDFSFLLQQLNNK